MSKIQADGIEVETERHVLKEDMMYELYKNASKFVELFGVRGNIDGPLREVCDFLNNGKKNMLIVYPHLKIRYENERLCEEGGEE